jgi:hypothetical protein
MARYVPTLQIRDPSKMFSLFDQNMITVKQESKLIRGIIESRSYSETLSIVFICKDGQISKKLLLLAAKTLSRKGRDHTDYAAALQYLPSAPQFKLYRQVILRRLMNKLIERVDFEEDVGGFWSSEILPGEMQYIVDRVVKARDVEVAREMLKITEIHKIRLDSDQMDAVRKAADRPA